MNNAQITLTQLLWIMTLVSIWAAILPKEEPKRDPNWHLHQMHRMPYIKSVEIKVEYTKDEPRGRLAESWRVGP